jgi:predicted nucleic acid-binding Zn ribbon protein
MMSGPTGRVITSPADHFTTATLLGATAMPHQPIPARTDRQFLPLFDRLCKFCGGPYRPTASTHKYCSDRCREEGQRLAYASRLMWVKEDRDCHLCGTRYTPNTSNQKFCSDPCREKDAVGKLKLWQPDERRCLTCQSTYMPSTPRQKFCSKACRRDLRSRAHVLPDPPAKPLACYTNFNDLHFLNEQEFEGWFRLNFALFGIRRLVKLDRWFPDCRAEMFDGSYLDIELEYHAKNFERHGHDSGSCDLIISFVKFRHQDRIAGLPVIAIFDIQNYRAVGDFDPDTKVLTPYFRDLVTFCQGKLKCVLSDQK